MQSKQRNILNLVSSMATSLALGGLGFLTVKKASPGNDTLAAAAMAIGSGAGMILGNQISNGVQDEEGVKALIKARVMEKLQQHGMSEEQVVAVVKNHDFAPTTPPRYGFWQNMKNLATTAFGGLLLGIPIAAVGAVGGRYLGRYYDRWQDKRRGREGDEAGVLGEVIGSQVGGLIGLPFSMVGIYRGNQYFDGPDQRYIDKEVDRHLTMLAKLPGQTQLLHR